MSGKERGREGEREGKERLKRHRNIVGVLYMNGK